MNTPILATALLLLLATPLSADAPDGTEPQQVWGTTVLLVKSVLLIDYNPCGLLPPGLLCDDDLAQRGMTYFDTSGWNSGAGSNTGRELTAWVEWTDGIFPPIVGGFTVLVCSDLNDNGLCSNLAGDTDAVALGYSNDGPYTLEDGPFPSEACAKDEKDCGDPFAAEVSLCLPVDDDGSFDDVGVFLGSWADAELESNLGAGISEGHYDVYLTPGDFVASC